MKLLQEYGNLDNILANLDKLSPKMKELIGDGKMAKHSQFLATIRTDVPCDIEIMDLARQSTAIQYTPQFVEFLRKYEFKSLLPITDTPEHEIFTLKNPAKTASGNTIIEIEKRIKNNEPYSLAADGENSLSSLAIAFSAEEIYDIELTDDKTPALLQFLIDTPYNLTVYNWKECARKMLWTLKN